jgi:hypothetical protein
MCCTLPLPLLALVAFGAIVFFFPMRDELAFLSVGIETVRDEVRVSVVVELFLVSVVLACFSIVCPIILGTTRATRGFKSGTQLQMTDILTSTTDHMNDNAETAIPANETLSPGGQKSRQRGLHTRYTDQSTTVDPRGL